MMMAVCALVVLGAASTAAASTRDRNRDRIPDKWEKRNGLSLRVEQTRRDQDRDGLDNLGEFRANTNPRDRDTDNDGIRDGKERAGTIQSFDGTTLVISLFGGGTVSGTVNASTEVKCEGADDTPTATTSSSGRGESGSGRDDNGGEQGDNRGPGNGEAGDERGNDGNDGNERNCSAADLKVGAEVQEAELRTSNGVLVYDEVELGS
jgi:hypothetical protein